MAPSLLGFVILILLPSPSLARSPPPPPPPPWPLAIDSKLCGSDRVAYEESAAGYRLIINERIVDDPLLICAALEAYSAIGCFAAIRPECCDRDTYGRRGLLEVAAAPDQGNWAPEERRGHRGIEKKDFAVPGMLLLCCAVICPCFRPRRRSVGEHQALSKELSSMESVSSLDINSASEKAPGTPLRIPPSPARVPPSPSRFSISPQLSRVGSIHLSVSQIYKATQNFSPSLRLGEGGFGTVYKAVLPDGQVVAVKRAKKEHLSTLRDEFSNEVELLSKIEHRSLVKLLGYTEKGNERIIITEHVPNGTLREHLDGQHGKILDFNQRLEIAIDVAHALTYLHLYAAPSFSDQPHFSSDWCDFSCIFFGFFVLVLLVPLLHVLADLLRVPTSDSVVPSRLHVLCEGFELTPTLQTITSGSSQSGLLIDDIQYLGSMCLYHCYASGFWYLWFKF